VSLTIRGEFEKWVNESLEKRRKNKKKVMN
jgi:hypothetical protein